MYRTAEREIAEARGATTVGQWRVGYVVEAAEPWFAGHGTHAEFREPRPGETHHLEIIPVERSTGRIVPTVPVHVQVLADDGSVVDEKDLNFYYAEFFHYANNFSVPEPGAYTIRHPRRTHVPAAWRPGRGSGAELDVFEGDGGAVGQGVGAGR